MAGPDGADPEGTVNSLVQRRLRELAEQARSFRRDGEPPLGGSAETKHIRRAWGQAQQYNKILAQCLAPGSGRTTSQVLIGLQLQICKA